MKAKKGQVVYTVRNWNGFNVYCVEKVVIKSWGKKQATAFNFKTGEMLEECIYLEDGNCSWCYATRSEAAKAGMKELNCRIDRALTGISNKEHRCTSTAFAKKLNNYGLNGLHIVDRNEELEALQKKWAQE